MIYSAFSLNSEKLLTLPETGMGYQVIEASLSGSWEKRKYMVYNSELVVDYDFQFQYYRNQISTYGFKRAVSESPAIKMVSESIKVLSNAEFLGFDRRSSTGAKDGKIEYADGKEVFVRLSPYEDDKRIDFIRKRLREGSFTTTQDDYIYCVAMKENPIERYALPSNEKINWAFYIQPKILDPLQRGIVQPAFNHKGGGKEVYFAAGTSDNTYLRHSEYGKL